MEKNNHNVNSVTNDFITKMMSINKVNFFVQYNYKPVHNRCLHSI